MTSVPGKLLIQHYGTSSVPVSDWSNMIQLVAYKLVGLSTSDVNLCGSYVGIYSKTIHFQVTDVNNLKSNIYTKTMVVKTGTENFLF